MTTTASAVRSTAERLILPATFITFLGNNVQLTASALLVARDSGTALGIAWVFIATAAPQALLSIPFGHLADRFDRRDICLVCDLLAALLAIALPVWLALGGPATTASYTTSLGLSMLATLFTAAGNALVKERVDPSRVRRFSADYDMATSAGSLLSTAVGGVAIQLFGPEPLFWFNGLTFLASAGCWYLLGRRVVSASAPVASDAGPVRSGRLRRLGLLYALGNTVLTVSNVLIVVLVVMTFRHGPGVLGVVDGSAGTGMLVAGVVYKRLSRRWSDPLTAAVGFGALVVICLLQPNIGPAGMALFLPGGVAFGLSRIAVRGMLMREVDDSSAGRVFGRVNGLGLALSIATTLGVSLVTDHSHVRFGFALLAAVVASLAPIGIAGLLPRRGTDTAATVPATAGPTQR